MKTKEDIIRLYGSNPDKWDWYYISCLKYLSEDFIREFKYKVKWGCISYHQKLSEDFIREFQDRVYWNNISHKQKLSEEFIREFKDKIDLKWLSKNKYCPPDIKFKYYIDNNMLTKEDPLKHSIEEVIEKKDNSLEELKKLVGV